MEGMKVNTKEDRGNVQSNCGQERSGEGKKAAEGVGGGH